MVEDSAETAGGCFGKWRVRARRTLNNEDLRWRRLQDERLVRQRLSHTLLPLSIGALVPLLLALGFAMHDPQIAPVGNTASAAGERDPRATAARGVAPAAGPRNRWRDPRAQAMWQ